MTAAPRRPRAFMPSVSVTFCSGDVRRLIGSNHPQCAAIVTGRVKADADLAGRAAGVYGPWRTAMGVDFDALTAAGLLDEPGQVLAWHSNDGREVWLLTGHLSTTRLLGSLVLDGRPGRRFVPGPEDVFAADRLSPR